LDVSGSEALQLHCKGIVSMTEPSCLHNEGGDSHTVFKICWIGYSGPAPFQARDGLQPLYG